MFIARAIAASDGEIHDLAMYDDRRGLDALEVECPRYRPGPA